MEKETKGNRYLCLYGGENIIGLIAHPRYVLLRYHYNGAKPGIRDHTGETLSIELHPRPSVELE